MMSSKNSPINGNIDNKKPPMKLSTISEASYSGPLPLPSHLEKYEQTLPGAAERIMKMAENQQEHRIRFENCALKTSNIARILGLCFALILFLGCLILSGFALFLQQVSVAFGMLVVGIAGPIIVFITGKPKKKTDETINLNQHKNDK